jgi:hypothetical protein
MSIEVTGHIIQLILAPVVMITSSAILVNGVLTLYSAVNARLRAMTHERLELLRSPEGDLREVDSIADTFARERLRELDTQLPLLLRRHSLIHKALLFIYCAILLFVASMFIIAVAAVTLSTVISTTALLLFLVGTAMLLISVGNVAIEIGISNQAVSYEVRRVLSLGR